MRSILMLSLLLAVSIGTVAGSLLAGIAHPADIRFTVETLPGVTRLTLQSDGVDPLDAPITRLVAIPEGAADPSATISARSGESAAAFEITVGSPMVLRGLTVLPITIAPRAPGATKSGATALHSVEIEVR